MCGKPVKIDQGGFSLIELIIVVLTIAIIAVIAIPNILSARRSANEGSTISALRILHGAQVAYKTTRGAGNYAGTADATADTAGLAILHSDGIIDASLASGTKAGYRFVGATTASSSLAPATFFFSANPVGTQGAMKTGTRRYAITQRGVIGADPTSIGVPFDSTTAQTVPPFDAY